MSNKSIKMIVVMLLAIVLVASLTQGVFAEQKKLNDTKGLEPDQFYDVDFNDGGASESVSSVIAAIINIVQVIGTGVAIIMLVVLAIKYISAAPGDKADIKKHAVVYVVGAIVLFAATGILGIVKQFAGNIQAASTK